MAAQAESQHTRIGDPDDLLRYLTEELGFQKGVAIYAMNQHYHDGQLRLEKQDLIRDGEPYGGWIPIDAKYGHLELDGRGRMRVVPRTRPWREASYRIAEQCDARAIWPLRSPASETAGQQPKGKPRPDPFKTEVDDGLTKVDGWQVRRVKEVLREFIFPPNGRPPADATVKAVQKDVNEIFDAWDWKLASRDSVARAMGRRRA
jgi:hypothetical protein